MADEIEKTEESKVVCKRCGRADADAELEVSEEVMQQYMRSLLGGVPFSTSFKIANGKITAEFRETSADIADKLQRILGVLPAVEAVSAAVDFKLMFTLRKLEFIDEDGNISVKYDAKDFVDKLKFDDNMSVTEKFKEFSKKFDEVMLGVLRRMSVAFALLLKAIADKLTSSDFYEGVGLL